MIDGGYHHVAIVSHCWSSIQGKRNQFFVARLQKPRGNVTEEELENLWLSNDVESRAELGSDRGA